MTNSKIRRIHHQGKVGFAVVIVMALAIAVFAGQVVMTELKDAEMDEDVDYFPPFEWVTPEEKRAEAISTGIQYMGVIALLFLGSILFKSRQDTVHEDERQIAGVDLVGRDRARSGGTGPDPIIAPGGVHRIPVADICRDSCVQYFPNLQVRIDLTDRIRRNSVITWQ